MLLFKVSCVAIVLVLVQTAAIKDKEAENKRTRRDAGLTAALIGAAISAGASLTGTTVGALKRGDYSVAVSGSITNFVKWNLALQQCDVESGYMNVPMRSTASGKREGFAGHKEGNTATGSWIKCTYRIGSVLIHFMYSAPYSFDFNYNTLAVAICQQSDSRCKKISINDMYSGARPYLTRLDYYRTIRVLKNCKEGFCVTGVMGTSHHAEIAWKVYPMVYDNLSAAVQGSSAKDRWDQTDYDRFVVKELQ